MLLPSNSSLREQKFAQFLDARVREDYSCLDTDPLKCEASILPHLAVWLGVDIDGLSESESRAYLKSALLSRTKKGTVGVVEDALNSVFDNSKVVEWWEDGELDKGTFDVEVVLESDVNKVYDGKKFETAKGLMDKSKNVRSHLKQFKVKMPPVTVTVAVSTLKPPVSLHLYSDINEQIESGFEVESGWVYKPTMHTDINESLNLEPIQTKGGYRWQVEV